jgi:hypothetical protein
VDDTDEWFDGLVSLIDIFWRRDLDIGWRPFLKSL